MYENTAMKSIEVVLRRIRGMRKNNVKSEFNLDIVSTYINVTMKLPSKSNIW
jgi:hypothetical protein